MAATHASQGVDAEPAAAASPAPAKFRYATKTALSLTLAYLIPMSMGWPQPQTAAITVMLIAATGLASDSLQKGVTRVLGTVAGALIGLSLIALFPQDRLAYLLAASLVVAVTAYLYNAYQGDSTLFMLTSVVTLMMFNGGDAEGAFLYGADRAFMTAFGVIVYTAVASTLWPVRAADNTRALAATVTSGYRRAFARLAHPADASGADNEDTLTKLLASEQAFQTHFSQVKRSAEGVAAYRAEWDTVLCCYEELETILVLALQPESTDAVEYSRFLADYQQSVEQVAAMFHQLEASWRGQAPERELQALPVVLVPGSLQGQPHLTVAAVATRAELLRRIQQQLLILRSALDSMLFDGGGFAASRKPRGKPAFIWLDLENVKTAVRSFITFWIATAIWIAFNPPGGFLFVTLATVLVPLVSFTPVTPRILFILLSLGFLFALPAYVFLLPQMTHWFELSVFMFGYALFGFYVFQGPVSIFFLLGLFTLGIQNTMNYHFDVIMLLVLTFYLLCALLVITTHFPFTSRPERIYASLRGRFFHTCAQSIALDDTPAGLKRWWTLLQGSNGDVLLAKLNSWGSRIDSRYFTANAAQQIAELNRACTLLHGQLQVLSRRRREFAGNPLIAGARQQFGSSLLVQLCETLAADPVTTAARGSTPFDTIDARLAQARESLEQLRRDDSPYNYDRPTLAQFYVYLNLRTAILNNILNCHRAQQALAWKQLKETRF